MSFSLGGGKSKSSSESKPLTPDELAGYYGKLDTLAGGRLGEFGRTGRRPLTIEEIQAAGGAGATRKNEIARVRADAIAEIDADPNYTLSQRQRATQLNDRESQDRLDAINQEIEAQATALTRENRDLTAEDLKLLADIFFGGKGQYSSSASRGFNFNTSGSVGSDPGSAVTK